MRYLSEIEKQVLEQNLFFNIEHSETQRGKGKSQKTNFSKTK